MRYLSALACSFVLLAGCASPGTSNLRVSGDRIFIEASLNGAPMEALLDSGAEMTLIDTQLAEAAGLTFAEQAQARGSGAATVDVHFIENVDLAALGIEMPARTIVALDLSDVAERVVGEPVTMVMGRDLFDTGRLFLDIEAGLMRPESGAAVPAGSPLPLSDAQGIKQVPISIDGHHVMADFDLGNGSGVLVSRAFAQTAGLLSGDRQIGQRKGGGLGGAVQLETVRADRLEIAGTTFCDITVDVTSAEGAADANIGVSILRHFRMMIDFPENKVWLQPSQGLPEPDCGELSH
tara:strand:+ start:79 stop:960 length:882 start_codon:yes stop_codon:yes gene_type:complete